MAAAAKARGANFGSQEGTTHATAEIGTLVVVEVKDYRYLSPGARIGFGVMTGNAYVDANRQVHGPPERRSLGWAHVKHLVHGVAGHLRTA